MSMDLYRLYGADNELLYVGISYSAIVRLSQHKTEKHWFKNVERCDIESLGDVDRREAERIERRAIMDEKPRHNVIHNRQAPATTRVHALGDGTPKDFDATGLGLWAEWHDLATAMDALARALDRAERDPIPSRGEFVRCIDGLSRSLVYGDCCDDCGEIRSPVSLATKPGGTHAICRYVCIPCRFTWTCTWSLDISMFAGI